MLPEHRAKVDKLVIAWLILVAGTPVVGIIVIGGRLEYSMDTYKIIGAVLLLVSWALSIKAAYHISVGKGQPASLAAFGLLKIFGLIILALYFKDAHPQPDPFAPPSGGPGVITGISAGFGYR